MYAPSDIGMKKKLMNMQIRNASCNTHLVIAATIPEDPQHKDKMVQDVAQDVTRLSVRRYCIA